MRINFIAEIDDEVARGLIDSWNGRDSSAPEFIEKLYYKLHLDSSRVERLKLLVQASIRHCEYILQNQDETVLVGPIFSVIADNLHSAPRFTKAQISDAEKHLSRYKALIAQIA